jgi:hypothetical protein
VTVAATDEAGTQPVPAHGLASTDVASAIYGSMLVTVLIAAQNRAEVSVSRVGLYVVVGVFAFWLTHIWATLVGMRLHGTVTRVAFREAAREESPMLAAAVLPFLALGVGLFGAVTQEQALTFALWVAVAQLFLWGVVVGRAIGRPWRSAIVVGLVDLMLGLGIVALKVFVLH